MNFIIVAWTIVKCIIGALAGLFAAAHVVFAVGKIFSGNSGPLEFGALVGHFLGFCIGLVIAIACFKPQKKETSESAEAETEET